MNKESNRDFLKIFVIYFTILVLFVGVRISARLGVFSGMTDIAVDAVSTAIIQIGILFIVPFILYKTLFKKKTKQVFADFGYKKISWKAVLICFAIGILSFIINIFIANFFSIVMSLIGYNPSRSLSGSTYDTFPKFLFGILSVAVFPAVCEEFVHRGLLLRGAAKRLGYKKAIIISSIFFGLMHMNIQQFFYATILGALMGVVVTMTRSIYPAMILHFCNNFINVFLDYAESQNLFGFSINDTINAAASRSPLLFFIFVFLLVLFCVIGILWLLKKLFIETGSKRYNEMFENIENQIRSGDDAQMSDLDVIMTFEKYVFPHMKSPENIFDLYIGDNKHYDDLALKYKIPMIACFCLGALITIFTFIWGVI